MGGSLHVLHYQITYAILTNVNIQTARPEDRSREEGRGRFRKEEPNDSHACWKWYLGNASNTCALYCHNRGR